jgi:hypothetical protein
MRLSKKVVDLLYSVTLRVLFMLFIAEDIPFSHRQHGSVPGPPPSHCMLCFVLLYWKHKKIILYSLLKV